MQSTEVSWDLFFVKLKKLWKSIYSKCKWAIDGLKNKQFTVRELVQCGFQNRNVIICCKEDLPPIPGGLQMQTTTKKYQPGDIVYTE